MEPLHYFRSRKGISRTSLHCGVLNKIRRRFFSHDLLHTRKQKTYYRQATYEDNFSTFPQPRILFWFTSSGFLKRPVLLKYWLLRPFFYEEATCKSSTVKGLLYAAKAVPSKDYFTHLTLKNARKGRWVISPDYRTSHPRCFCAVGDVVAQRYDILRDWLWVACHMVGVRWGSRCKGFRSKEGPHYCLERSARKLSQDKQQSTLFTSLEIPLGFHTWAVLRSLARPRWCKKVSVRGF